MNNQLTRLELFNLRKFNPQGLFHATFTCTGSCILKAT